MSAISQNREYTVKEYFSLVEESAEKLEYHDGKIRALAGGSSNHSIIAGNINAALNLMLREKDGVAYNSDMAVSIAEQKRYVFPDVSVVCGKRSFEDSGKYRLLNPTVIIEVLSERTEAYDRGDKFAFYRSLPSFKEYILISSDRVWVESFYRKEETLRQIFSTDKLSSHLKIQTLNLSIPVSDLYLKTSDIT